MARPDATSIRLPAVRCRMALLPVLFAAIAIAPNVAAAQEGNSGAIVDPAGDTLGRGSGQPDIRGFSALQDSAGLSIRVDFEGAAARPDGIIDIDVDGVPGSGVPSIVSALCPQASGLGAELRINLFSFDPASATVSVLDQNANELARLDTVITQHSLELRVPDELLGSTPAHLAATIGSASELTDCVPDSGYLLAAGVVPGGGIVALPRVVPAASPFTWLLLAFALVSVAWAALLRRH